MKRSRRTVPQEMRIEVWRAPDGWPLRTFRREGAGTPKGSLLFLGGRGDFFEKYLEAIEDWHQAGWNVGGFDWRGQGGSGRLHAGGACHIDDFGTFVHDLTVFCRDWQAKSPGPRIAIGHSLGGHVLLRAVAQGWIELDGIVLLAPMLGIRAGPLGARALGGVAALGTVPGLRNRALWSAARSPAPGRVTSCPERQADKLWWKAAQPELGRGGPTWGWLRAAMRSIAELDILLQGRPVMPPGLLLAAADDPIVDSTAIRRALRFLPDFAHAEVAGAGHELLRERDGPREVVFAHIRRFLAGAVAKLSTEELRLDRSVMSQQ